MSAKAVIGKFKASSNVYTAILALTCAVIGSTAAFVALKYYMLYGTIFKIIK